MLPYKKRGVVALKITNHVESRLVATVYSRVQEQEKLRQSKSKSIEQVDRVEISSRGKELQLYRSRLKELPDVRQDLVDSLKRRLEEGSYYPDAKKIAEAMIREVRLDKRV